MSAGPARFSTAARFLHWSMAAMIVAMLFIGAGMAATVSERYALLTSIHKPLGIAILAMAAIRIVNRLLHPPPPLPLDLPRWQRRAAAASHHLLYGLMAALPLLGWGMLSAAPYPIVLFGALHLPPILPRSAWLYAYLRHAHTLLAYLLFATFLLHAAAALFHGLIRRDGVLESMAAGVVGDGDEQR